LAEQQTPLSAHCACYACRRHSRAYIHHLICAHEMLGAALLATHNWTQLSVFMSSARAAVVAGQWPAFRAAVSVAAGLPEA
jgi:tRNA-guanine family transglycosylase